MNLKEKTALVIAVGFAAVLVVLVLGYLALAADILSERAALIILTLSLAIIHCSVGILLNRLVLTRIASFGFQVRQVTLENNRAARVVLAGNDELSNAAVHVNSMLQSVQSVQTDLANQL